MPLQGVRPIPRVLLADELVYQRRAALAFDIAAPVEFAMAALVLVGLELVVATAAAHELAAVHSLRGLVAEAALRAQGAGGLVAQAVVGARVDVDQVFGRRGVESAVDLFQLASSVDAHGGGAVVLFLQELADAAEVGQLEPTGFEAARTRHSVALARDVGQIVHRLSEKNRLGIKTGAFQNHIQ